MLLVKLIKIVLLTSLFICSALFASEIKTVQTVSSEYEFFEVAYDKHQRTVMKESGKYLLTFEVIKMHEYYAGIDKQEQLRKWIMSQNKD